MRLFSGFIFTKIIHNTVLALNNAVRSSITSVGRIAMNRRMWVLPSGAVIVNADKLTTEASGTMRTLILSTR